MHRAAFVLAAALVLSGCGGSRASAPRPLPLEFVRAPASLRRDCSRTARAVGYAVPCPTRVPRRLVPTPPAGPSGCVVRIVGRGCGGAWTRWVTGSSEVAGAFPPQHLVLTASSRPVHDYAKATHGPGWYPAARVEVGEWTRVNGRRMRWVFLPPETNEGSAFADHLVLVWTAGGHTYAVGFHVTTTRAAARALDLELARHLRLVSPRWAAPPIRRCSRA
jgi:hypothetical protein